MVIDMSGKRDAEIRVLTEYMKKDGSQLLILYGERGVGKSTLLSEFTKDYKDVVRFDCSIVSEREQLYMWGHKMAYLLGEMPEYPEFSDIFNSINRLQENSKKRILIFDEFQNITYDKVVSVFEILKIIDKIFEFYKDIEMNENKHLK